jgi:hypothetical protein
MPAAFQVVRSELPDELVIIARWDSDESHIITMQDFIDADGSFLPLFSDSAAFDRQIVGSGFEDQGVIVKTDFLLSMFRGGERLILDPGGNRPRTIIVPDMP